MSSGNGSGGDGGGQRRGADDWHMSGRVVVGARRGRGMGPGGTPGPSRRTPNVGSADGAQQSRWLLHGLRRTMWPSCLLLSLHVLGIDSISVTTLRSGYHPTPPAQPLPAVLDTIPTSPPGVMCTSVAAAPSQGTAASPLAHPRGNSGLPTPRWRRPRHRLMVEPSLKASRRRFRRRVQPPARTRPALRAPPLVAPDPAPGHVDPSAALLLLLLFGRILAGRAARRSAVLLQPSPGRRPRRSSGSPRRGPRPASPPRRGLGRDEVKAMLLAQALHRENVSVPKIKFEDAL